MERLRRQDLWRRPMGGRLPSLECGKVREDAGILRVVRRRPFSPRGLFSGWNMPSSTPEVSENFICLLELEMFPTVNLD